MTESRSTVVVVIGATNTCVDGGRVLHRRDKSCLYLSVSSFKDACMGKEVPIWLRPGDGRKNIS